MTCQLQTEWILTGPILLKISVQLPLSPTPFVNSPLLARNAPSRFSPHLVLLPPCADGYTLGHCPWYSSLIPTLFPSNPTDSEREPYRWPGNPLSHFTPMLLSTQQSLGHSKLHETKTEIVFLPNLLFLVKLNYNPSKPEIWESLLFSASPPTSHCHDHIVSSTSQASLELVLSFPSSLPLPEFKLPSSLSSFTAPTY